MADWILSIHMAKGTPMIADWLRAALIAWIMICLCVCVADDESNDPDSWRDGTW